MKTTEAIMQHLGALPEAEKQEVLRFVECLQSRCARSAKTSQDAAWSSFSLAEAMRGMEDEDTPYGLSDLREVFR